MKELEVRLDYNFKVYGYHFSCIICVKRWKLKVLFIYKNPWHVCWNNLIRQQKNRKWNFCKFRGGACPVRVVQAFWVVRVLRLLLLVCPCENVLQLKVFSVFLSTLFPLKWWTSAELIQETKNKNRTSLIFSFLFPLKVTVHISSIASSEVHLLIPQREATSDPDSPLLKSLKL